jgi:hypothetical protein
MEDSGIQSSHRNTTGIISTGGMGSLAKDGAEGTISLAAILDYEGSPSKVFTKHFNTSEFVNHV